MIDPGNVQFFPAGVAYVLAGLGNGGTEKHVRDLVARLDRGKFSPRVISIAGGGPLEEEFSRLGIPVHILEYRGVSGNPDKAAFLLRQARAFFRRLADGETGFLVRKGDAKGFGSAILRILQEPGTAHRMGMAGRRRAMERFSMGEMVTGIERTYLELLDGEPPSCRV